ncbi:unnamed protein product [Nezara viridula]|uniref:C2H2-type domain-containing protein n=1 Tax=Nezara viridula TaxID=85310 RepID=A0A9P0MIP5_NEZVI|nr:unnamed protein product [Nezara viridula]CAH1396548.1 unnamed protein product [Nezara viridula]CAH1396549.1 unnamed protein product [Nezara viridula]CAH1396550.1 unnamed protein product [Nezara viridula]
MPSPFRPSRNLLIPTPSGVLHSVSDHLLGIAVLSLKIFIMDYQDSDSKMVAFYKELLTAEDCDLEPEVVAFYKDLLGWESSPPSKPTCKPSLHSTRSLPQQEPVKLQRYTTCKKSLSEVFKKLASNGVTITGRGTVQQEFQNKQTILTSSTRFHPLPASPKKSSKAPILINESGSIKKRMQPKMIFSKRRKVPFRCTFCTKRFKSQERLKFHHQRMHGIIYLSTWLEIR